LGGPHGTRVSKTARINGIRDINRIYAGRNMVQVPPQFFHEPEPKYRRLRRVMENMQPDEATIEFLAALRAGRRSAHLTGLCRDGLDCLFA